MWQYVRRYHRTEDGAISADWMVLSAGVIALAIFAVAIIGQGAQDLTDETTTTLAQAQVVVPDTAQDPD